MTLYSADILDLAKPVSAAPAKKGRAKKTPAPEPVAEPTVVEEDSASVEKPKRVATEKQLAALAKAQETRKRKKEEAAAAKEAEEKAAREEAERQAAEAQALLAKKEAQKEKRRLAREAKKLATPPDSSTSSLEDTINRAVQEEEEDVAPKPKRQKKTVTTLDEATPPTWFKQYVAGVKKEEAKVSKEKKPQRQIQEEAHQVAEHQWKDGFTRDRVRNEVDNHMSRMYHMMFGGRRLK